MKEAKDVSNDDVLSTIKTKTTKFLETPSVGTAFELITSATSAKTKTGIEPYKNNITLSARIIMIVHFLISEQNVPAAREKMFFTRQDNNGDDELVIWFFLLVRCRILEPETYEAFSKIKEKKLDILGKASKEIIKLKWRYEGPDDDLLYYARNLRKEIITKDLTRECVALGLYLNRSDFVISEIENYPWLTREYDRLLPLASFLVDNKISESEEVIPYCELYHAMRSNFKELSQLIRNNSLAVVGNSPCEIGGNKGSIIDSHSLVARFNYFSIERPYTSDYGKKFDIHIRGAGDTLELAERSRNAKFVILSQYDFFYHFRNWKHLKTLHEEGVRLCCMPEGHHFSLQKNLRREPSLGLSFLKLIKDITGTVDRNQCFGFSFIDQLTGDAHYFDKMPPAYTHNWLREKQIFDELTSRG